jgi:hypothetical protein
MEKLRGAVGRHVRAVALEVQFHGVETKGLPAGALIDFADGARFALGCAGDGGISVTGSHARKGDARGFVTESRTLGDLSGELRSVAVPPHGLRLQIGERELLLVNEDDELSLTVDSKALPQEILRR